jgi:L,D-peptidoglycan transpeptidase YkuD (ErfK/YbiS/YcfS/YnhG family)
MANSRAPIARTLAAAFALVAVSAASPAAAAAQRLRIPASARQLIVVSSPTADPPSPGYLAAFRTYQRAGPGWPWMPVFGRWQAETGSGHLLPAADRRAGDHATPIGVFAIGLRMYGNRRNPGGLHYAYHHLVCGDWWDGDPFSATYNHFVHVACGSTPDFAGWSEPLWRERHAYPYFAVIEFNSDPIVGGPDAPGAGIFLHHWMGAPTEGCIALRMSRLLAVLRWLRPSEHPVIEIAPEAQLAPL